MIDFKFLDLDHVVELCMLGRSLLRWPACGLQRRSAGVIWMLSFKSPSYRDQVVVAMSSILHPLCS